MSAKYYHRADMILIILCTLLIMVINLKLTLQLLALMIIMLPLMFFIGLLFLEMLEDDYNEP